MQVCYCTTWVGSNGFMFVMVRYRDVFFEACSRRACLLPNVKGMSSSLAFKMGKEPSLTPSNFQSKWLLPANNTSNVLYTWTFLTTVHFFLYLVMSSDLRPQVLDTRVKLKFFYSQVYFLKLLKLNEGFPYDAILLSSLHIVMKTWNVYHLSHTSIDRMSFSESFHTHTHTPRKRKHSPKPLLAVSVVNDHRLPTACCSPGWPFQTQVPPAATAL